MCPATRFVNVALTCLSCLFALASEAQGNTVYQQSPQHFGGFFSSNAIVVADEFSVGAGASVTGVRWWGGYGTPELPAPVDDFEVRIYSDAGGAPGALLVTYHAGAVARVLTGDWVNPPDFEEPPFPGRPEYEYRVTLPSTFVAVAGVKYWLSIINNPSSDSWAWEVATNGTYPGVQRSFSGVPGWQPYAPHETAFALDDDQVAYQQSPQHLGGFLSSNAIMVADEFSIGAGASVTGVRWWGGYGTPELPAPVDDFEVRIYSDAGGAPGALLVTYHAGAVARVLTGDWVNPPDFEEPPFPGRPEYEYHVMLPTSFVAVAGVKYWLSVINNPSSDSWFWEVATNGTYPGVQRSFSGVPGWQPYAPHETAFALLASDDLDADGVPDSDDNCPTVANTDQADGGVGPVLFETLPDGVGNACDNCVNVANPRVSLDFLALNSWATLTGGQRDDDHDGYGNRCDAKFVGSPSQSVGGLDLAEFRTSQNEDRRFDTCGTVGGSRPCAIYDLDESAAGNSIGGLDLGRFRQLQNATPGPRCEACTGTDSVPLPCIAGTAGSCAQ